MQEFEIIFYEDGNGNKPVEDFILNLDNKMRAKMLLSIRVIKEKGPQTRLPFSEELEDGIFELKAKSGSNISRVLYFFVVGRRIVLTNGFIKKTQKTPRSKLKKLSDIESIFSAGRNQEMKDDYERLLDEQLKNDEFRKEWEALEPEYTIMKAMIDARTSQGLTQKELSMRSGIAQGDISKMENGNANPSIKTLQRLASAMGKTLKIEFVDADDVGKVS